MSKTHIWLLHKDSPTPGAGGLRWLLAAQLQDPFVLPRSLFSWLIAWFLLRKRCRTQKALDGPCPSIEEAQQQADELNRLLGSDFQCHILRRYDQSSETVLRSTPSGSNVILVPMLPYRSAVLYTALNHAREALKKKKSAQAEIHPIQDAEAYVEAHASRLREQIINQKDKPNYGIVFLLDRQPERTTPPEYEQDIQRLTADIMHSIGGSKPFTIISPQAISNQAFTQWKEKGIELLITSPLGWTTQNGELTQIQQQINETSEGLKVVHASALFTHSEFMRLIVERITNADSTFECEKKT